MGCYFLVILGSQYTIHFIDSTQHLGQPGNFFSGLEQRTEGRKDQSSIVCHSKPCWQDYLKYQGIEMKQTQSLLPKMDSLMGRWFDGKPLTNDRWVGCEKPCFIPFTSTWAIILLPCPITLLFSFILHPFLDVISVVPEQPTGSVSALDFCLHQPCD